MQHDPLPKGFAEVDLCKEPGENLGIVIKGGLRGQPGNPLDGADEGVFCVRVNPGGAAARDSRIKVQVPLYLRVPNSQHVSFSRRIQYLPTGYRYTLLNLIRLYR